MSEPAQTETPVLCPNRRALAAPGSREPCCFIEKPVIRGESRQTLARLRKVCRLPSLTQFRSAVLKLGTLFIFLKCPTLNHQQFIPAKSGTLSHPQRETRNFPVGTKWYISLRIHCSIQKQSFSIKHFRISTNCCRTIWWLPSPKLKRTSCTPLRG
jgi:hypothetical protein